MVSQPPPGPHASEPIGGNQGQTSPAFSVGAPGGGPFFPPPAATDGWVRGSLGTPFGQCRIAGSHVKIVMADSEGKKIGTALFGVRSCAAHDSLGWSAEVNVLGRSAPVCREPLAKLFAEGAVFHACALGAAAFCLECSGKDRRAGYPDEV